MGDATPVEGELESAPGSALCAPQAFLFNTKTTKYTKTTKRSEKRARRSGLGSFVVLVSLVVLVFESALTRR